MKHTLKLFFKSLFINHFFHYFHVSDIAYLGWKYEQCELIGAGPFASYYTGILSISDKSYHVKAMEYKTGGTVIFEIEEDEKTKNSATEILLMFHEKFSNATNCLFWKVIIRHIYQAISIICLFIELIRFITTVNYFYNNALISNNSIIVSVAYIILIFVTYKLYLISHSISASDQLCNLLIQICLEQADDE